MLMTELENNGPKSGCVVASFITGLINKGLLEYDPDHINECLMTAISSGVITTGYRVLSYVKLAQCLGCSVEDLNSRTIEDRDDLVDSEDEFTLLYTDGHCELYMGEDNVYDPGYQGDTKIDENLILYHDNNGIKKFSHYNGKERKVNTARMIKCNR